MLSGNISALSASGLLERTSDRLVVSRSGRPVLNAVLRQLLAD